MIRKYKEVVCADGFTMSVQANRNAYCDPAIDSESLDLLRHKKYTLVEVGFPSKEEPLIMPWAEDKTSPTNTVYGYVPVDIVTNVIVKHGGIIEGEVPPGVIPVPRDD